MPDIKETNYFIELTQAAKARDVITLKNLLTLVHVDLQDPICNLTVAGQCAFEGDEASAQFLYQNFHACPDSIGEGLARSGEFSQAVKWCTQYGAHPNNIALGLSFRGDKKNYAKWYDRFRNKINLYNVELACILGKHSSALSYRFLYRTIESNISEVYNALYYIAQVADIETLKALLLTLFSNQGDLLDRQKLLLPALVGLLMRNRSQEAEYLQENLGVYLNEFKRTLLQLYTSIKKGTLKQHDLLLSHYQSHPDFKRLIEFSIQTAIVAGYLAHAQKLYDNHHIRNFSLLLKGAWINPFDGFKLFHKADAASIIEYFREQNIWYLEQINNISDRFWSINSSKHSLCSIKDSSLRRQLVCMLAQTRTEDEKRSLIHLNHVLNSLQHIQPTYQLNQAELLALFFYPIEISRWILEIGPILCKRAQLIPDVLQHITECFSLFLSSKTESRHDRLHSFLSHLQEDNATLKLSKTRKVVLYDFFKIQPSCPSSKNSSPQSGQQMKSPHDKI